jgi:hypothetical protein
VQHFGRFGSPSLIRSDRGSHFANDLIKDFLDRTGNPHNPTLAYSKQENALVERVNREINRHLRVFIFDSIDLASYSTNLPFVQRILNASVHSTGVSPASLLLGNRVTLDKGIFLPPPEVPTALIPASSKVADMILTQESLMTQAATRLRIADEARLATQPDDVTTFAIDSFVPVQYASMPPTRLHTKWEGPVKVISSILSECGV